MQTTSPVTVRVRAPARAPVPANGDVLQHVLQTLERLGQKRSHAEITPPLPPPPFVYSQCAGTGVWDTDTRLAPSAPVNRVMSVADDSTVSAEPVVQLVRGRPVYLTDKIYHITDQPRPFRPANVYGHVYTTTVELTVPIADDAIIAITRDTQLMFVAEIPTCDNEINFLFLVVRQPGGKSGVGEFLEFAEDEVKEFKFSATVLTVLTIVSSGRLRAGRAIGPSLINYVDAVELRARTQEDATAWFAVTPLCGKCVVDLRHHKLSDSIKHR